MKKMRLLRKDGLSSTELKAVAGTASVWSSAGNTSRATSELGLTTVEQESGHP